MKKLMLFCCTLLLLGSTVAQSIRVVGRVTSAATGNGAEGVTVTVKGSKTGTTTGSNGEYVINVAKDAVLVFSGIGFTTQEQKVTDNVLNISLKSTTGDLGEVVVVGYGSQKKASLTGALVTLGNTDLNRRQVSSTSQALQGLAPGVTVQQQSGKPGADGASIVIRGQGSISGSNAPLIIVDGLAVGSLDLIDPNVIESITLLKDAASTAIYGNRASAGVILVKTKRAVGNTMKLSYNGFVSKQQATAIPKRVSGIDHMRLSNVAEQNRTGNPAATIFPQALIDKYATTAANNLDVIDTDWLNEILTNSGLMQNHNVQLNAGGEKMNLFGSFTYLNQQGLIQNSSFQKYDLRLNPEFKISDKLKLIGVLAYTNTTNTNPSTGSAEFIIRQAIGLPAIGGGKFGPGMYGNAGQSNNRNPIAMAEATGNSVSKGNTLLTRFGFNFRPIDGLEVEGYWGKQTSNPTTKTWVTNADIYTPNLTTSSYTLVGTWPGTTSLSESYTNNVYTTYLGQATYTKRFGVHTVKALVGGQSELFTNYFFGASRQGFVNPNQPYLNLGSGTRDNNAGASELALAGFFARINYSYDDKYFLELNGRRDGTSRFSQARNKQWGNFGAVSAGWIFTKESFLKSILPYVSYGKLRASIGGNGNQNIGNNYAYDAFYSQSNYSNPINGTNAYFGGTTNLGLALLQFANPELSWETSKQWNIGLDVQVIKHFTVSADYYVKTLKNMLLQRTLPQSAGGLTNPFVNAGNMENKGWEFSLNYKNQFGKLGVNVTGMISDVKNKVLNLVEGTPFIGDGIRTAPGEALGSYFGYVSAGYFSDSNDVKNSPVQFGQGWNPSPTVGSKPGDVKYADTNGDGKIDANDRVFIGNAFPRYEYSINVNLTYGNWDMNIFGQGVGQRNNYLSGTGAIPFNSADFAASLLDIHKDYWRPDNQNATFPRLLPSGSGGNNFLLASQWIRSAAYFRIKNISVGYTVPKQWLNKAKISNIRIYVSASNLLTLSKAWKGFDPEINSANAEFYPLMRTYTAGVNVTF
ncbi:MAG: TonB-dependent receptor [Sediminibacterium sp.]|nr:TonB-dependent receptor [Sediminibacterium sp.]